MIFSHTPYLDSSVADHAYITSHSASCITMLSPLNSLVVLQGTFDQPSYPSRCLPFCFFGIFEQLCRRANLVKNSYEVLTVYDGFLQRVLLEITLSDDGRHLSTQVGSFSPASGETQVLPDPPPPVICYLGDVPQRRVRSLSQFLS